MKELLVAALGTHVTCGKEGESCDQCREAAREPSNGRRRVCTARGERKGNETHVSSGQAGRGQAGSGQALARRAYRSMAGAELYSPIERGAHVASTEHCCPCEKRSEPRQLNVAETKHVWTLCTLYVI